MATRVRRLPEVGSPASGELAPAGQANLVAHAGGAYHILEPLRHDGEDYPVGSIVVLSPAAAAPLLTRAVVALAPPDGAP
jgi:hypothetical protein